MNDHPRIQLRGREHGYIFRSQVLLEWRVVKLINHLQLALEPFILRRIANDGLIGYFNSNIPAIHQVEGPIYITHPTLGQVRQDLVSVELVPICSILSGIIA